MPTNRWDNRIEIRSETSNRVYVVAQHAERRHWACSCPGWRRHRRCKHLQRLGLPSGEEPFEVGADRGKSKGFLDGYPTYDDRAGRGTPAEWRKTFAERLGLAEARRTLGLAPDAGWDEVRRVLHLAAAESLTRLVADYEAAVRAFDGTGPPNETAAAVLATKFRLDAYAAYLAEQQQRLEAEQARVTRALLSRIESM